VTLIVVSGAPATGKSTIAAALAAELRWPLLSLDPVKETLADVLGLADQHPGGQHPGGQHPGGQHPAGQHPAGQHPGDERWSDRLGYAAAEIIFRLTAQFPDAVAEGWWRGARRELALAAFAGAVEVFCRCPPELAARRMRDRHRVSRHPIHRDVMNPAVADRAAELARTVMPLGLGAALIEVDTGHEGATARAVAGVRATLHR
jgi:hypothetical protein